MKLIITRGLPGSGKSIRARAWVAEAPESRVRVNRDDLRGMAHSRWVSAIVEKVIRRIRDAAIIAGLKQGFDVVCDDTNLDNSTVKQLWELALREDAEFEIWDLTDVDVETCITRDAERGRSPLSSDSAYVGEKVIRNLHTKYVKGRPYPLPQPNHPNVRDFAEAVSASDIYVPDTTLPTAFLVDIDGTVALMDGRRPYEWARVGEDKPNWPVLAMVRALAQAGYQIVFMSGRDQVCEQETLAWLHRWVPLDDYCGYVLFMRPEGDSRKDSIVKRELFDKYVRDHWNVVGVFDDRQQVVDMWRELGLTVAQVAPGDF